MPEINREQIAHARLVANPGCYPTCSTLSIYPLVKEGLIDTDTLIIDAKSGVSGAGRGAKVDNLYCEVNESCKAYGVATHRHTPEIEEQLSYAAGKLQIIEDGVAVDYSEEEATRILSQPEVTAVADIKMGDQTATAWGCDLTFDYVKINADYRS